MTTPAKPRGVTRVYRGRLTLTQAVTSKQPDDPRYLRGLGTGVDDECPDAETPLAEQIARTAARFGQLVSLRYVVGETREETSPTDPFGDGWTTVNGLLDAEGTLTQSSKPGGWTVRERLKVGGRDVLAELRAKAGQFCHLEITYSPAPAKK